MNNKFFAFILVIFLLPCVSFGAGAGSYDSLVPPGTISMFGGTTAPEGYLLCNGTLASTTAYYQLFLVVGYTYGGSGTSFKVPDMRGVFPKGFGQNGILGANYANASGTPLADKMQGHWHYVGDDNNKGSYAGTDVNIGAGYGVAGIRNPSTDYLAYKARAQITDGSNGTPRTGAITEPANVGVSFIIKY